MLIYDTVIKKTMAQSMIIDPASPASSDFAKRDIATTIHPYTNLKLHEVEGPMVITQGEGVFVRDENGKTYLEGMAGLWCASLGFSERRLAEAAYRQMLKLPMYHTFLQKSTDVGIDVAEKLLSLAPGGMSKVFFVNSGSEANDTAVKLVTYYNNAVGRARKKKIIYGGVGGLFAGAVISILLLSWLVSKETAPWDADDVEDDLGLTVVGSIEEIPSRRRHDRGVS